MMGTKNNPGKFDCYENAEPDEPMFVLLARDPQAPMLVQAWTQGRYRLNIQRHGTGAFPAEEMAKMKEAEDCAHAMSEWRAANRPEEV